MATRPRIKLRHSPVVTYSPAAAQGNYVGAQATAGRRGTLPTFTDLNTYYIAKTGSDANAGTSAAPKLTLKSLFSTSKDLTSDQSGANNDLTEVGTLPWLSYPCHPIPPQGNYAAGPFSDSNYLRDTGGGLYGALNGATAFSVDFFVYARSLANAPIVFSFNDGASDNYVQLRSDGTIRFQLNGTNLDTGTGVVTAGKWYYIKVAFSSGTTNGKRIYCGLTPESAVLSNSATQTHTIGATTDLMFGRWDGGTTLALSGYMDRITVTSDYNITLPTRHDAANLDGFYPMETAPLMQSAPMDYIVIKDSETYEESFYANFPHGEVENFGIYAADGQTPIFKQRRGAKVGTYGAGHASRALSTSSASTTCFVSKAGNDGTGTRGNPGLPFLTIQAAINATTTSGDTVQIQDSGEYVEDLSLGTRAITIQAALGAIPVLKPATLTGATHLTSGAAVAYTFNGLTFRGGSPSCTLLAVVNYAVTVVWESCSILEYDNGSSATATPALSFTYNNCYISNIDDALTRSQGTHTFENCKIILYSIQLYNTQMRRCTYYGLGDPNVTSNHPRITGSNKGYNWPNVVEECKLEGYALLSFDCVAGATYNHHFSAVLNSDLYDPSVRTDPLFGQTSVSNGSASTTHNHLAQNCKSFAFTMTHTNGELSFQIKDCVSFRRKNNATGTLTASVVDGLTALIQSAEDYVLSAPSSVSATRLLAINSALGIADGGVVPTYSTWDQDSATTTAQTLLSDVEDSENLALQPGGGGIFAGDASGSKDVGTEAALFEVVVSGFSINGITFSGAINTEVAINSASYNRAVTISYCTFQSLGPSAILAGAESTISNCLFSELAGHAIRIGRSQATISNCVLANCAGAGAIHYGTASEVYNNSSYACLYGIYDSPYASYTVFRDNVLAQSSVYDYSGESEASYSCIGTLDPDRANSVAATSIRQDPLYRDPENGDLRLMAEAAGSLFTSPAKGTGTSSADMGAFAFTYGTASTAWTTVDFGTSGYYNPDRVVRNLRAINLSEEDRDDLALKSSAFGFRTEYQLSWEPMSAMPAAQVTALAAAFSATTNQVQIQLDGSTWLDGYLARGEGFEYTEEPGYSDDTLPVPLRSLAVRLANA